MDESNYVLDKSFFNDCKVKDKVVRVNSWPACCLWSGVVVGVLLLRKGGGIVKWLTS